MALLGIDFGGRHLRAAVAVRGAWPSPDDVVDVPAVFSFHGGRVTVGETVLFTAGVMPDVIVREAKRMIGRLPGDPLLERLTARQGLTVRAHGRGDLWLGARNQPDDVGVSLERAVAALLEHVVETATGERGGHDVVLAIPRWFGEPQREALRGAAERAHLHVQRFVLDGLAAAIFVGARGGSIAIADAGSGGVSATVVRGDERRLTLVGAHGDASTGAEEIIEGMVAASGISASGADRELLRQCCESVVDDLAAASEISRAVDLSDGSPRVTAARWELDLLLAPLAERVIHTCTAAVRDVKIERAYVMGGMMAHAAVRDAVTRRWGRAEALHPAAAALGAAMAAASPIAIDDGEATPHTTTSVSSLPPGIGAPTSSRLSSPVRPRPKIRRRRLSPKEIQAKRQSVGLTPTPAHTSVPPVSSREARPVSSIRQPAVADDTIAAPPPVGPTEPAPPPRSNPVASQPPPSGGASWPNEGTISPPARPEDILEMPLARPMTDDEVEPVALPVLLRRCLSRPGVRGTLRLEGPGVLLVAPVDDRAIALSKSELLVLQKAFDAPRLRWRLDASAPEPGPRDLHPLPRLAAEGVRRMLRHTGLDELERALADRLERAPRLRGEPRTIARRLHLEPRELRLLERHLDGTSSARDLGRASGLGDLATFQLLAILELYGTLSWVQVIADDAPSLSEILADRADRWERANHFDVLGVHWSTTDVDLASAYEARAREYGVGSRHAEANPAACAAIRHRIDRAYALLRDPAQRVKYRNEVYRGLDFSAATEIARQRGATLRLRGEDVEAKKSEIAAQELAASVRRRRRGSEP